MPTEPAIDATVVAKVLQALAKPEYKWRTVQGVSKETGLTTTIVLKALAATADSVIKSSVPSVEGEDLYTTREHFRKQASAIERLRGAIKNRAI